MSSPHHAETIEFDIERPENHYPYYIFPFVNQEIAEGKKMASGIDIQTTAHCMDASLDRFKVTIVGDDRKTLLLERPLVEYPYLHQFNKRQTMMKNIKGVYYDTIQKQETVARNEIVEDDNRLQQFFLVSIDDDAGPLTAEYFPAKRTTSGDEVDYDFIPVTVNDNPSTKKSYTTTTVTLTWKVVFEESVGAVESSKNVGKKGASKFDDMEELQEGMAGMGF